jgi:hypothetical protein
MNDIHAELRTRVETFTDDLAALVRRAALDAVRTALAGGKEPSARRGRPPAPSAPRAAAGTSRRAVSKPSASRRPGQKRDPKLLERLVERLAAHIASKPGQRIEQINKPLGVPTKELSLPIKKLLRANRIVAKGQKRSTTYWPK